MMERPLPPFTKLSKRKVSSQSALSYSKFNASKEVKEIANPAKLTGKLKAPKDGLNDDLPQPIPEVQVINNPQPIPAANLDQPMPDANLDQPVPEV
jgi:hypothetical protein